MLILVAATHNRSNPVEFLVCVVSNSSITLSKVYIKRPPPFEKGIFPDDCKLAILKKKEIVLTKKIINWSAYRKDPLVSTLILSRLQNFTLFCAVSEKTTTLNKAHCSGKVKELFFIRSKSLRLNNDLPIKEMTEVPSLHSRHQTLQNFILYFHCF